MWWLSRDVVVQLGMLWLSRDVVVQLGMWWLSRDVVVQLGVMWLPWTGGQEIWLYCIFKKKTNLRVGGVPAWKKKLFENKIGIHIHVKINKNSHISTVKRPNTDI
jgi:hypothetical protein